MFGIIQTHSAHERIFLTYEDLISDLNKRMTNHGYKVVKARSHRSKLGGPDVPSNETIRVDLICQCGGRYKSLATKHRASTKKTGCPWKAKAVNRKTLGGWVLTIVCDEHNHEPGTPDPSSPPLSVDEDVGGEMEASDRSNSDPDGALALAVAGLSRDAARLSGDTFHQLKQAFRKMTKSERLNLLSQMQLRIAAIYTVENEELQRQQRQDSQSRRHHSIHEDGKVSSDTCIKQQRHPASLTEKSLPPTISRHEYLHTPQPFPSATDPAQQVLPQIQLSLQDLPINPSVPMQTLHHQSLPPHLNTLRGLGSVQSQNGVPSQNIQPHQSLLHHPTSPSSQYISQMQRNPVPILQQQPSQQTTGPLPTLAEFENTLPLPQRYHR